MLIKQENEQYNIALRQLKIKHNLEEMAFFPFWTKSSDKERIDLIRIIGERQAKEIMLLIKKYTVI